MTLKLRAKDAEDLQVVSAILQDAIVPVCDVAFRPEEKDFVMIAQRFCHEGKDQDGHCERVRSAVHVTGVSGVQRQGIDQDKPNAMLDLLAIMSEKDGLEFVFAGGGIIRLKLADWSMILEDFGEPWPAACEPCHEGSEARG
jgi:hypothetical protein